MRGIKGMLKGRWDKYYEFGDMQSSLIIRGGIESLDKDIETFQVEEGNCGNL